jgi:hypothetical protein
LAFSNFYASSTIFPLESALSRFAYFYSFVLKNYGFFLLRQMLASFLDGSTMDGPMWPFTGSFINCLNMEILKKYVVEMF